jgi:hypothetical protein
MNYKQINENWQRYLTEAPPEINTVGDLKKLLLTATAKGREAKGKEQAIDIAKGFLADLLPGGGTIKTAYDAYKAMYMADDKAKKGTGLDYLNVDDKVGAIVDDAIETAFLKDWLKQLDAEPPETPLENYDVNKGLADFIKDTEKLPAGTAHTPPTVRGFAE